jgi:preprotein translocase subunit SecG
MFSSWTKIFTLIAFGVKIDHLLSYSWKIALIPIYITIAISLIICIASIILILLQYATGESDKNTLTANLWLVYTSSGATLSVMTMIFYNKTDYLFVPIVYIIGFSIITRCCQQKLAYWWWEFFISEMVIPMSLDYENMQLSLPESQRIYIGGAFTEKLKKAIILTPKALVKLANPQIQTRSEKIVRKKHNRSSSHVFELKSFKVKGKKHTSRSKSMAVATGVDSLDLSRFQNLCKFCFRETVNCKFVGCGHGGVCMHCGDIILQSKRKCYICGAEIVDIIKEELDIENNILAVIEESLD